MAARYKYVKRMGHPLAPQSGRISEHRWVLWEKIGPGKHQCHWCAAELEWSADKTASGCLVADHLDGNGRNNAPDNLAPACHGCNVRRGHDLKFSGSEPWMMREGIRCLATKKTCQNPRCGKDFLVVKGRDRPKSPGKFCSRACHYESRTATVSHQ